MEMVDDIDETLQGLLRQLQKAIQQREAMDRQIAAIRQGINGFLLLQRSTNAAANVTTLRECFASMGEPSGLTEGCRMVLRNAAGFWLTPIQIKQQVELAGFDFSSYKSNPLSSIYTILRRLVENGEISAVHDSGKAVGYQWNPPPEMPPPAPLAGS